MPEARVPLYPTVRHEVLEGARQRICIDVERMLHHDETGTPVLVQERKDAHAPALVEELQSQPVP